MPKIKKLPYNHEDGFCLIEIRLNKVQQLFSSLDPAPFRERDLDPAAESYIIHAIRDFPLNLPMKIILLLPEAEPSIPDASAIPNAVRNYFTYRKTVMLEDLKALLHSGWISFLIALIFLVSCLVLRQMAENIFSGTLAVVVNEGLLIMGWVAMWRPINIFLYEWWPFLGRIRIFDKLKDIEVELRTMQ